MNEELATAYTQATRVCGKHTTCDNKTRYVSYADALKHSYSSGLKDVEAYLCSFCKTWHFGNRILYNDLGMMFIIANVCDIG